MVIFQILNLEILQGIYAIKYLANNLYFTLERNNLILSKIQSNFRLILIKQNLYYIEIMNTRKKLGVNNNNKIIIYDNKEKINENKKIWNITKVRENEYIIYNLYNFKIIEIINNSIKCSRNIIDLFNINSNKNLNIIFNFIKLVEEAKIIKKFINIIKYL
jgi:hypothetical protein